MKLIRNAFAAGFMSAAVAAVACSGQHAPIGAGAGQTGQNTPGATGPGSQDGAGTVGAHLTLAPGVNLFTIHWAITSTTVGGPSYSNDVTIGDAQSLEFVAGGILAGSYTLTITGTDSAGEPCTGTSAVFQVFAGATAQVVLGVVCTAASDASVAADVNMGSVEVDAAVTRVTGAATPCPGITSFSISPAELPPGVPSTLGVTTTGPASIITWSVSPAGAGTFSDIHAANPTFQCLSGPSQETITATVALLDGGACTGQTFTTMSALFNCEGGSVDAGVADTFVADTFVADTFVADTFVADTFVADTFVAPSGACQPGNNPPGCIPCDGNTNGLCTPTEAAILNRDISRGLSSGGLPASGSCYECLVTNGCVNDDVNGDSSKECGDVANSAGCMNTLNCILGSGGCPTAADGVVNCYCGTNNPTASVCASAPTIASGTPGAPNGTCALLELAGLGDTTSTSNSTIINVDFGNLALGSGKANQIFSCAGAGTGSISCPQCL